MQQRKALGQGMGGLGLSALVPTPISFPSSETIRSEGLIHAPGLVPLEIEIEKICPNRYQPRENFDQARLLELAQSIKSHGLIQPIVVRALPQTRLAPFAGVADDIRNTESTPRPTEAVNRPPPRGFELIAGERRLRAATLAGLVKIPAIIREVDDHAMMEYALLENVQREELNPIEKAKAYSRLISEFSLTQEQIAAKIGMDRSSVANTLRLLQLPDILWEEIAKGSISMGHAKVLLSLPTKALQIKIAQEIKSKKLSVRQIEVLAKRVSGGGKRTSKTSSHHPPPEIRDLENRLQQSLGTKVRIASSGNQKGGYIQIEYYSLDDLDRLLEILTPQAGGGA